MYSVGLKDILDAFFIYVNFSTSYFAEPTLIFFSFWWGKTNVCTYYLIGISERIYNKL